MHRTIFKSLIICLMGGPLWGSEGVAFSRPPGVQRSGAAVSVTFELSAPSDVEVAVLDGAGKVVRHLAAGVLGGKNAPPPPLLPGLAQALTWDRLDDAGKKVEGSVRFRVRAGMGVSFGKIIGGDPRSGTLSALALAPDGSVYVLMGTYVGGLHHGLPLHVRKFDRNGAYQKTVLPHPPSTPAAKASAFKLIDTGTDGLTPANNSPLDSVLFTLGASLHDRVVDNSLVFIESAAGLLHFFKLDGSNELRTVPMRTAPEKLKWSGFLMPQLAFSPDGKCAYYSNVACAGYDCKKPSDIDPNFPNGRIYRHDFSKPGSNPDTFFNLALPDFEQSKYWLPSAWDMKSAGAGLDVDSKGNLFICDLVNQEVVEVAPDGTKRSSTKVPWPDKVSVSSKTGALYVVSREPSRGFANAGILHKVVGRGAEARIAAKLPLQASRGQSLALDDSGPTPVIWTGGNNELLRVEDRGTELAPQKFLNSNPNAIGFVSYGDVDSEADLVYVANNMGSIWRYDGVTGEGALTPIKACDLAIGPAGMIYTWGVSNYSGPVARYTRDFKPAPLGASGKNTFGHAHSRYGRGNSVMGLDVDPRGRTYVANGANKVQVEVYDAEGQMLPFERKEKPVADEKGAPVPVMITGLNDMGGIKSDAAGNVYVVQHGLPKSHLPPKGFEKDPGYMSSTGLVYKFGPQGGEFKWGKESAAGSPGLLRTYSTGCGPLSGAWNSTVSVCHCTKPRFDVDGYGRLYIPHGFTYSVTIRDNSDNEILTLGGYGNFDAQGPKSAEPKPEIPLGWPITVGASDRFIYVGDELNARVVRADKTWKAEAVLEAGN